MGLAIAMLVMLFLSTCVPLAAGVMSKPLPLYIWMGLLALLFIPATIGEARRGPKEFLKMLSFAAILLGFNYGLYLAGRWMFS